MRTYIDGQDDERECICNFNSSGLVLDYENEKIYCPICGDTALMPSYWDFLTETELKEYFMNPQKKVYDFGENGLNIPANESVINYVRAHIGV